MVPSVVKSLLRVSSGGSCKLLPPLPCGWYGISTYQSKLVLVCQDFQCDHNMLVSDDGIDWQSSLLPVPTRRECSVVVNTATPEYLIVAGGFNDLYTVEVLMEKQWWTVPSLPGYTADWCLSCRGYAFHDGKLYIFELSK